MLEFLVVMPLSWQSHVFSGDSQLTASITSSSSHLIPACSALFLFASCFTFHFICWQIPYNTSHFSSGLSKWRVHPFGHTIRKWIELSECFYYFFHGTKDCTKVLPLYFPKINSQIFRHHSFQQNSEIIDKNKYPRQDNLHDSPLK